MTMNTFVRRGSRVERVGCPCEGLAHMAHLIVLKPLQNQWYSDTIDCIDTSNGRRLFLLLMFAPLLNDGSRVLVISRAVACTARSKCLCSCAL
jgi:hypothetical protein